jgi:hypothetical protein
MRLKRAFSICDVIEPKGGDLILALFENAAAEHRDRKRTQNSFKAVCCRLSVCSRSGRRGKKRT